VWSLLFFVRQREEVIGEKGEPQPAFEMLMVV
jgi:hypothetical protein